MNVSNVAAVLLVVLICDSTACINWLTLLKFERPIVWTMPLADWLEMKSFSTNFSENVLGSDWLVIASMIFEVFFWMVRHSGLNADMFSGN